MKTKKSHVPIDEFSSGGIQIETSAELNTPETPLVFVEISEPNSKLLSAKFVTDPESLEGIADKLKQTAEESRKQGDKFWNK